MLLFLVILFISPSIQGLSYRERACNSFNGEIKSVTILSNTKLKEIFEFSVYFPSIVLLFLVTLFISPSMLSLWELQ